MNMEADVGAVMAPGQGTVAVTGSHQKLGERQRSLKKEAAPLTPSFRTCGPQNGESDPTRERRFATAALENEGSGGLHTDVRTREPRPTRSHRHSFTTTC